MNRNMAQDLAKSVHLLTLYGEFDRFLLANK